MDDFLTEWYLWIKSLHVISVIGWMAGMMYLPRLYVYHAQSEAGSDKSETFKIMERRLLRGIINPTMFAMFLFGVLLLLTPGVVDWSTGWIWVKLTMVLLITAVHGVFARWRKTFERDENVTSHTVFRLVNEVPFVFMMVIVVMVIVKPF